MNNPQSMMESAAPPHTTPHDATSHPAARSASVVGGALTEQQLASYRRTFEADGANLLAQNAVTQSPLDDVALNRRVVVSTDHTFSHLLDDWKVTNQKQSGRCWCFAGLNLLRVGAMKAMNLKDFEFSQNFTLFWDKLERANYFLQAIIETSHRDVDDRTVAFLLDRPLEDGGQWNMFVSIIQKHGLVPQAVMPESISSSSTGRMNSILLTKLRESAKSLRDMRTSGAPLDALHAARIRIMETIHRILCIHLGTPPEKFDWQWNDKDRKHHSDGMLTPRQFAQKYVTIPLEEYVCLVHDPREGHPLGKTYTVEYLGNVVGGTPVTYLNISTDMMKRIARDAIVGGEPVWFGCDVGKMMQRKLGIWDANLFEYDRLYRTSFDLNKADRLVYHVSLMTHAMLFTGVDVVGDSTRRWRVENSWGEEDGRKGFYVMNDSWFDEYVFEIAARKCALPAELQSALQEKPVVLPAWDPMGALAR